MSTYIIGLHAIESWLHIPNKGTVLFVAKENKRNSALSQLALERGVPVEKVGMEDIGRRAGTDDHKGIALRIPSPREMDENDLKSFLPERGANALMLLLDGITDPRNLGAILRSAEQFTADGVIIPKRRGAGITPEVSRSSTGADAIVPLFTVVNISRSIEMLKESGFWVYGADMAGKAVDTVNLTGKAALVMGSEGKGLGQNVRNHCDELLSIPTGGNLDSLNVSVAAGILLYEIRRQQQVS